MSVTGQRREENRVEQRADPRVQEDVSPAHVPNSADLRDLVREPDGSISFAGALQELLADRQQRFPTRP
jgi:hypothetical protein